MGIKITRVKVMSAKQYRDILGQIAQKHGTTADEVEREILASIDEAWSSPDPLVKARQNVLFKELGRRPTPREFLSFMASHFGSH